jgi:tRNA(adenine34) deaminase
MHETKKNYSYLKILIKKLKKTKRNQIPIAACVTDGNNIIGYGQNKSLLDHAEIIAIKKTLKTTSLKNPILYTSLEPCLMCVGATINAGIKIIYYGCRSPESGIHTKHNYGLLKDITIIPLLKYEGACKELLQEFFKKQRNKIIK